MNPAQVRSTYRRMLNRAGETVTIRRYSGTGAERAVSASAEVIARVTEFRPSELVGVILQGDRKLIVMAEDLSEAAFPLPLRKGDKAVVRGKELNIEAPDDSTRRVAGELIAYELQARG